MKNRRRYIVALLAFSAVAVIGVWCWTHRQSQSSRAYPGYASVASADGTSTASTQRTTAILRSRGISCVYETVLVADFYVPTNQVAQARLVLAGEKLLHWRSIWSIQ